MVGSAGELIMIVERHNGQRCPGLTAAPSFEITLPTDADPQAIPETSFLSIAAFRHRIGFL